jgi:hypothetical protein
MQNPTKQNGEYRNLALEQLEESTTNPRKRFNQASLMELESYVPRHISGLLCR